jgi:hypothetical protein
LPGAESDLARGRVGPCQGQGRYLPKQRVLRSAKVGTLCEDARHGAGVPKSHEKSEIDRFLSIQELLKSDFDGIAWVAVEDDCITSGSIPYNPEDEYSVGPNGQVYLKCGELSSAADDREWSSFKEFRCRWRLHRYKGGCAFSNNLRAHRSSRLSLKSEIAGVVLKPYSIL